MDARHAKGAAGSCCLWPTRCEVAEDSDSDATGQKKKKKKKKKKAKKAKDSDDEYEWVPMCEGGFVRRGISRYTVELICCSKVGTEWHGRHCRSSGPQRRRDLEVELEVRVRTREESLALAAADENSDDECAQGDPPS